jgi:hypothetical protein
MLEKDPIKRISIDEILRKPIIEKHLFKLIGYGQVFWG